jgi:endoglucanase
MTPWFLFLLLLATPHTVAADRGGRWPLWESYAASFIDSQGRVIDSDESGRTTSEGQAYALFFALVADDRERFGRLLSWTEDNLAQGDLGARLPAWHWGKASGGPWGTLDANSASDADLWIAYTLLQAGRLWSESRFTALGSSLAGRIAREEVTEIPVLGSMLRPGVRGFHPRPATFVLNPSYLPLQLVLGLGKAEPSGPWMRMADQIPHLIQRASPKGFPLDWVTCHDGGKFRFEDAGGNKAVASYDAIRVYLWAGMLHTTTPGRKLILTATAGMAQQLKRLPVPPAVVGHDGKVKVANAGPGFSAALIPYLTALRETSLLAEQQRRLQSQFNPRAGLYGSRPRYYDQNLALFSEGWSQGRYFFAPDGQLERGGMASNQVRLK